MNALKNKKIAFCVAMLVAIHSFKISASPAYPYPVEFKQPDGTIVTIQMCGDEFTKFAKSIDGYTLLPSKNGGYEYAQYNKSNELVPSGILARDIGKRSPKEKTFLGATSKGLKYAKNQTDKQRQAKMSLEKQRVQRAFPPTGKRKMLCIVIGYKDLAISKTHSEFDALFNQKGYDSDGAKGSVRDFYLENSHGQLDLDITVAGPYVAANDRAYYGANSGGNDVRAQELVTEAVKLADKDVDFSEFDNDGDNYTDGIYILYAGNGEEAGAPSNSIWAHASSIPTITLDGTNIKRYACSAERRGSNSSGLTRIGVICHEFGHIAGAPDYYDINGSTGGEYVGTGKWDLMASGSWNNYGISPAHHNAYTKTKLYKWTNATVLSSNQQVSLENVVENNTDFYQINSATNGEYFLLENRQKKGFDSNIPGHGLIVYHVHKDIGWRSINTTHPQKMYPLCAGNNQLPSNDPHTYGYIASNECPFPGSENVTTLSDATVPNLQSWSGDASGVSLEEITETNDIISFKLETGISSINVESFSIEQDTVKLGYGRKKQLTTIITPDDATNKTVKWTTSNKNVAEVDANGVITPTGVGTTTISGETVNGGLKDDCTIIITNGSNKTPDVTIKPNNEMYSAKVGYNLGVTATAKDKDSDGFVDNVKLYIDNNLVRTEMHSPYEWGDAASGEAKNELNDLAVGKYKFKAVATDNFNATGQASFVFNVLSDKGACYEYDKLLANKWEFRNSAQDQNKGSNLTADESGTLKVSHRNGGLDHFYLIFSGEDFGVISGENYAVSFETRTASSIKGMSVGFSNNIQANGPKDYSVPLNKVDESYSHTRFVDKVTNEKGGNTSYKNKLVLKIDVNSTNAVQDYFFRNLSVCTSKESDKPSSMVDLKGISQNKLSTIYPNVVNNGTFTFAKTTETPITLKIYSPLGKIVMHKIVRNQLSEIGIDNLSAGIYLVQVLINGEIENHTLMVQ